MVGQTNIKGKDMEEYVCHQPPTQPRVYRSQIIYRYQDIYITISFLYIGHETAICLNPQTHSSIGETKNLTDPYCTTGNQVMFLRKHKNKQFFMNTTF
jgi:hypothetical protein